MINRFKYYFEMILTARGKPRRAKITKEAILIAPSPITCWIPLEYPLCDTKLIIAVPAMQANTIKLLSAQTSLAPIHWHIGSIKKELMPRTTYQEHNTSLRESNTTRKGKKIRETKESYFPSKMNIVLKLKERRKLLMVSIADINGEVKFMALNFEFLLNSIANQMHLLWHLDHKLQLVTHLLLGSHDKLLSPSSPYQRGKRETRTTAGMIEIAKEKEEDLKSR